MKKILITLFILNNLRIICSAQAPMNGKTNSFAMNVGIGRSYVDPDVKIELYGMTGEISWLFRREDLAAVHKNLSQVNEITLSMTRILRGRIEASALGLSYGRRYEFPSCYLGFGVGPFSYYLSSNQRSDQSTGYTLDTGWRLHVATFAGFKIPAAERFDLTFGIQYDFTIKHLYWHNPLRPHKHEDIFHYWTFNLGLML